MYDINALKQYLSTAKPYERNLLDERACQHEHMYESSNIYLLNCIVFFIVHKSMHIQSLVRFLHTVIISEYKIIFQYFVSSLIVILHLSLGIKS